MYSRKKELVRMYACNVHLETVGQNDSHAHTCTVPYKLCVFVTCVHVQCTVGVACAIHDFVLHVLYMYGFNFY